MAGDGGEVVSLDDRRRALGYDGITCPECGGAWFWLDSSDQPVPIPHGAVCLARDMRVTGFVGSPTCVDCGSRLP